MLSIISSQISDYQMIFYLVFNIRNVPAAAQYSLLLNFHFLSRSRWDEGPDVGGSSQTQSAQHGRTAHLHLCEGSDSAALEIPARGRKIRENSGKPRRHFQASVCGESVEINQGDSRLLEERLHPL